MRLAKFIAQRGVASRREAEELIRAGHVTVNGETAGVTTPVDIDSDVVELRGVRLPDEPVRAYYLLNKPRGYITSRRDPQGRKSVFDLLKKLPVRVEPVGRLDYDTEGALLLTNDGDLAHLLTHPSSEVPKVYVARVEGTPPPEDLLAIDRGIPLEDGVTAPASARLLDTRDRTSRVSITVHEGRNRLIRRMLAYLGHPVLDLRRESFAGIELSGLERGEVRPLGAAEVERLRALVQDAPKGNSPRRPVKRVRR
jgi:23S rRNA pseudouridine2605 synthase